MDRETNCDCTVDCDGQYHEINYCGAHKQGYVVYHIMCRRYPRDISTFQLVSRLIYDLSKEESVDGD